jgi:hypothetical protein
MTPTLLILDRAPRPGTTYAITTIVGDTESRTAVCRRMVVIEERKRRFGTEGGEYVYTYDLGEFLDPETGEIFLREIEVSE